MKKLDVAEIAAKSVEISKSLVNTQVGLHDYDLAITRTAGDTARFAATIRRSGIIDSEKQLAAVANALKLDYRVLKAEIITQLEDFDWISIKRDGGRIKRIDEKVPPIEDVLSTIGEKWEEDGPTEIDFASVHSLSELSKRPYAKDALMSELGIKEESFNITYNYGTQAQYLGKFISREHDKEIIWTPLYWATNIDTVLKFLEKHSESNYQKLALLYKKFIGYPGTPIEKIIKNVEGLVLSGIHYGFFPSVQIRDRTRSGHQYVFGASAQFQADPKKDIFEKARLIVACIRHGQYHAEVTKIRLPLSILRAMRNNTMKPHSYADIQYALLKLHGIINLVPVETWFKKAYKVIWIDSPENNLAAEMAEQMLKGQQAIGGATEELEAKKILVQGIFNYTSEQRKIRTAKSFEAKEEYERLMEYSMGVKL